MTDSELSVLSSGKEVVQTPTMAHILIPKTHPMAPLTIGKFPLNKTIT